MDFSTAIKCALESSLLIVVLWFLTATCLVVLTAIFESTLATLRTLAKPSRCKEPTRTDSGFERSRVARGLTEKS